MDSCRFLLDQRTKMTKSVGERSSLQYLNKQDKQGTDTPLKDELGTSRPTLGLGLFDSSRNKYRKKCKKCKKLKRYKKT